MRFDGRNQLNETYGVLIHSKFLGLLMLLNRSLIIHSRRNIVNFEAQNEIIGSELVIIE
jgi:peroxiredoxin